MTRINEQRCSAMPLYGRDFQDVVKIYEPNAINPWNGGHINCLNALFDKNLDQTTGFLKNVLYSPERRIEELKEVCDRFIFYVPAVKTDEPEIRVWHPPPSEYWARKEEQRLIQHLFSKPATPLHHIASAMVTQFPDPRLIQYDCGKLQTLDKLLRQLKCGSHRVLIFTQMTKMLDVLEAFLNFHGHIYLRLDGSTKVDQRQVLMERFNGDKRIFAFILSTRSGGVGVNLTGADTVVFYDSDWNPTMDAQAQDRCHRIGQTRDVHIYRLVSERTIEENILKKANQKRLLGDLAIEGGNFTTAYFKSSTIQDLFNIDQTLETAAQRMSEIVENRREVPAIAEAASTQPEDKSAAGALETALAACEDDQDVQAAKIAKAEAVADLAEFDENIPLEQETEKEREPEVSKAEQEINNIIEKLSPIEKYAMKFIEQTESAWSAEQLAAAARQIEEQKREWELNQMAAMREEEERRQRELDEENDMITYTREDATNQVSFKRKKISKFRKVLRRTKAGVKVLKHKSKILRSKRLKKPTASSPLNSTKVEEESISSSTLVEEPKELDVTPTEAIQSDQHESSLDSIQSESDLTLSELKESSITNHNLSIGNHVDHNSPRTRSRGTVAINLWTLDVSPILPGVRPVKNNKLNNILNDKESKRITRKRKSCSDDDVDDDEGEKDLNDDDSGIKKSVKKARHKKDDEDAVKQTALPVCKILLNDIIAEGTYKVPENVDGSDDSLSPSVPIKTEKEDTAECNNTENGIKEEEHVEEPSIDDWESSYVLDSKRENAELEAADVPKNLLGPNEIKIEKDFVADKNASDNSYQNDSSFMSEYERELRDEKTLCDNVANTATKPPEDISASHFIGTNGIDEKHDVEMPKENIELTNISKPKTFTAFKTPEPRKSYRKFKPSNNQTLDGWVTRTSPKTSTDTGDTSE